MLICKKCNGHIPDIGDHFCNAPYGVPPVSPDIPFTPVRNQKCDICGSTAIDHTEAQCQINRIGRKDSK